MAITLAFLQIIGMEWVAMILKNLDSQVRALGPRFFRNSTWMLSYHEAVAGFVFCRAVEISSSVNGWGRLLV